MRTYQKHLAAIEAGEVTKSNVVGIRKALNHVARLRAGWSGNRSTVTPEQADNLEFALRECAPVVVGELHESGLKLLRSPRYKRDVARVADLIEAGPVQFRLIGFSDGSPYYRVDCLRGSFRFQHFPWQRSYGGGQVGMEIWEVKRP